MKANVLEKTVPFTLEGRTYDLKATFWVEAKIYDRFGGGILDVYRGEDMLENLLFIMSLLINEAVGFHNETCDPEDRWEEIDARYLGRHLPTEDAKKMMQAVADVFNLSRPEPEESRRMTDEEKNASTGKQE